MEISTVKDICLANIKSITWIKIVQSTLYALSSLIFTVTQWGCWYYPHFTHVKLFKGYVASKWQSWNLNPNLSYSKAYLLKITVYSVVCLCFLCFSSVTQSCLTLCDPTDCTMPGLPVHHQLLEFTQTHVHRVGDAIQPSHPLSPTAPPPFSLSQHQGLFRWVSSQHQVAKVLEFQLEHQSFQWTPRTHLL